jgi:formylglycine-generating enzyme required for sulfatase activity
MKITFLIFSFLILSVVCGFSQSMQVQTNSGNKSYNLTDIQSITFGKIHDTTVVMVLISAGSFEMGQTGIAVPVHTVRITKYFYIGKYEVTQKQFSDVIGTTPSYFSGNDSNPVEQVSWLDVVEFCNALSDKEGFEKCYTLESGTTWHCDFNKKGYRLPTEAEWEYACRAGTNTDYYSGTTESKLAEIAWYNGNSNSTQKVGQKAPNSFGLYDMSGNVWEWCWDVYVDYTASAVDDPVGPVSGFYRVLRGGSWVNSAEGCRSAYRFKCPLTDRGNSLYGFRIARTR